MGANYIFSLQPTFTQGLIIGQLSILVLLGLILKYLFLDSSQDPFETSSYHPHSNSDLSLQHQNLQSPSPHNKTHIEDSGSTEWLNGLFCQIMNTYRSKLRADLPGIQGDEVARKRMEDYANSVRPTGFLDYIKVHAIDLGQSAPRLFNPRTNASLSGEMIETEFDIVYTDTLSMSFSTSYLFNYPMSSFARLPVSLTISLSQFRSSISIAPPSPTSAIPVLTVTIHPTFQLDVTTTSLMGSRAKLANVPKLHELIQHQMRRLLATRGTWKVVLPGLSTATEIYKETTMEPDSPTP
ncbi:hypothetical protein AMATHDRAFT_134195 [Amanita thiersii Skay4041]|uniref:SMP-LTD domain-containing protein n=1 Tax=Amanita thiersii Skay4041 TaxID=703135 RepID=A0A2A9P1L9_9AGAR|nr:hypothetical protein AMATHDRAFT_134195 [Amanita thiersii Skay4041]